MSCITGDLADGEQRFRDFAESSSDWIWETDASLRYTYFSDDAEKIAGAPQGFNYGQTRRQLLGDEYDREIWDEHLRILDDHKPFRDFTYWRPGTDDHPGIWLSISGLPAFDRAGVFLGYRGTGRGVTQRISARRAAAASEAQVRLLYL